MLSESIILQEQQALEILRPGFKALYASLSESKYSIKSTGLSYRIINSWDENEILLSNRVNKNGWRKFNSFELGWLKFLKTLRDFGLSIDKLKIVKQNLLGFTNIYLNDTECLTIRAFEKAIMLNLLTSQTYYFVIDKEAKVQVLKGMQIGKKMLENPILSIPVKPLVYEILSEDIKNFAENNNIEKYADNEIQILKSIQECDYEKLIIGFEEMRPMIVKDEDKILYKFESMDIVIQGLYKSVMLLKTGGKVLKL